MNYLMALDLSLYIRRQVIDQSYLYSVLNVKAVVAAFNQERALVRAFSVIVKTDCETDGALHSTNI